MAVINSESVTIDRTIIVEAIKHLRKRPFDLESKRISNALEQSLINAENSGSISNDR